MGVIRKKTLFNHLADLFNKKTNWDDLSDADQKSFGVYMINRFLSMDMNFIGLVNMLQPYTMQTLKPKEVYNLYKDLLPKQKFYSKYIKSTTKEPKFKDDLVKMICKTEEMAKVEVVENLQMLVAINQFTDVITEYLQSYGKDASSIKKLLKIEK